MKSTEKAPAAKDLDVPDPAPDPDHVLEDLEPASPVPDPWRRTAGLSADLHATVEALVEKAVDAVKAFDAEAVALERKAAHDAIDAAEEAIRALEAKLPE